MNIQLRGPNYLQTPNPEAVMRTPIMKKMVHQYCTLKGLKGTGRKLVHTMDQVLKKLSLQQIQVGLEVTLAWNVCVLFSPVALVQVPGVIFFYASVPMFILEPFDHKVK